MARDIIVTPRLRLRSPTASDLPLLHDQVLSDPVVMRRAFSGPLSAAGSRAFFDQDFDHEACGQKLGILTLRSTAEVIGFAGLMACAVLDGDDYELGFVLKRSAWGKGYAREIGLGQIELGFSRLGLPRILAQAAPDNAPSIAALTAIGMTLEAVVASRQRGERQVYVRWNEDGPIK